MPEDLCTCLDIVRNTVMDMMRKNEVSYHFAMESVSFLDEVALIKGCINVDELKKRRAELGRV